MKIAFIGAGVMGEAMISALLREATVSQNDIWVCDIDSTRLAFIKEEYKVNCNENIQNTIKDCDIIVLSIKPQTLTKVLRDLKGKLKKDQLILSIIAGARIDTMDRKLEHNSIIRVMPNTPAQIGQGMSVWTATDAVSQEQKDMVQTILRTMGKEIYVPDEKFIDMATAVSGSGPAYIFLIMEALTDAAVNIGLPHEMAEELVLQTVVGSSFIARETGKHPTELRNSVTSPGGTTAEGLLRLEQGGMRGIIAEAVIAAYDKAQSLGKGETK